MSSSMNSTPQKHPSQSTQDSSTSSSRDTRDQNGDNGSRSESAWNRFPANNTSGNDGSLPTSSYTQLLAQNGNFGDQSWPAQSTGSSSNSTNAADSKAWSTAVNIGSVAGGVVNRSKKQSAGGSAGTGGKGK